MALTRRQRDDLKSIATKVLSSARNLSSPELNKLADGLHALIAGGHSSEPHRLHGERTSNLFAHMVASLGEAVLVKEEDAGDVFSHASMQPPDWRIVLRDGRQLLVEVKNCHDLGGEPAFSMRATDLAQLEEYAAAVKVPLRIAIYWSRQRLWVLLPTSAFIAAPGEHTRRSVGFIEALTNSEMSLVGDRWIACAGPLRFRADVTDISERPSGASVRVGTDFSAQLQIRSVDLFCGTRRLEDPLAQRLASYLMMHGSWEETTTVARDEAGRVTSIDFTFAPDPELGGQLPEFDGREAACAEIGALSRMMSREFIDRTVGEDREAAALRLRDPAARLGCELPARVIGFELPIAVMTAIGRDQLERPIRDTEFDDDDDDDDHTDHTDDLRPTALEGQR